MTHNPSPRRILLARADRLGDTLLSLPVASAVKRLHPAAHVAFLTRAYAAPLLENHPCIDAAIVDRDGALAKGGSWRAFFALVARLRAERFDLAVILHPEWRLNLAVYLAGIPARVAPAMKFAQVLANVRVKQRRSLCRIHECDYALHLARQALPGLPRAFPELFLSDEERARAAALRASGARVGIHPGSGGSAANWRLDRYIECARALSARGVRIHLSWGPGEEAIRDRFRAEAVPGVTFFHEAQGLRDLLVTLSSLDLFLAPSTGPLHLATALRVPVIGLYSPVLACSPTRWGPHPPSRGDVFLPPFGPCPRCTGNACPHFDCMDAIPVDAVVARAMERLDEKGDKNL